MDEAFFKNFENPGLPEYVISEKVPLCCVWMKNQLDTELHNHRFHELVIVLSGHARHRCGREIYKISAGDVFVIKPGVAHAYLDTHEVELVNILYYADELKMPLFDLPELPGYHALFEFEPAMRELHGFEGHLHVRGAELEPLRLTLRALHDELARKKSGFLFMSIHLLMMLIVKISRLYQNQVEKNDIQSDLHRLGSILGMLQTNFRQPFKISELAKRAGMSQSGFYRAFRKALGVSPADYLIRLRLAHAAELLEQSNAPVFEIASASGFDDSNYFSRLFRKQYTHSPREYRSLFAHRHTNNPCGSAFE